MGSWERDNVNWMAEAGCWERGPENGMIGVDDGWGPIREDAGSGTKGVGRWHWDGLEWDEGNGVMGVGCPPPTHSTPRRPTGRKLTRNPYCSNLTAT